MRRKSFDIKKCFANNNNDSRINGILYSKVEAVEQLLLMIKKGLDLTFTVVEKFDKILKWKSACSRGGGILADKFC